MLVFKKEVQSYMEFEPNDRQTPKPSGDSRDASASGRLWWTALFVFFAVEAIFVAALVQSGDWPSSRRGSFIGTRQPGIEDFTSDDIAAYLTAEWKSGDTTLKFHPGSSTAQNPEEFFKALKSDFETIKDIFDAENATLPGEILIFGDELDEVLSMHQINGGWIDGSRLFAPEGRSAVRPLLRLVSNDTLEDRVPGFFASLSDFVGGYLDFYNAHPYEDFFQQTDSEWQQDALLAIPAARVVLDDQRLSPYFISLPERGESLFANTDAASKILIKGFYRYLLDTYEWKGFASLLGIGSTKGDAFEQAFGKPLKDLLNEFQVKLDTISKDPKSDSEAPFLFAQAKLRALEAGALAVTSRTQVYSDVESLLSQEVKRFRLPTRDLARRNSALGRLYAARFLSYPDPSTNEAKDWMKKAVGILGSRSSNEDAAEAIRNKWTSGLINEYAGNYEEADVYFSQLIGRPDLALHFLPRYADILIARRNFQRAADVLSLYLDIHPNNLRARFQRMSCLAKTRDLEGASSDAALILDHPAVLEGLHVEWKKVAEHIKAEFETNPDAAKVEWKPAQKPKPEEPVNKPARGSRERKPSGSSR
ncbi:MAG: tetratricopeptide repeat protein [bacterium]